MDNSDMGRDDLSLTLSILASYARTDCLEKKAQPNQRDYTPHPTPHTPHPTSTPIHPPPHATSTLSNAAFSPSLIPTDQPTTSRDWNKTERIRLVGGPPHLFSISFRSIATTFSRNNVRGESVSAPSLRADKDCRFAQARASNWYRRRSSRLIDTCCFGKETISI